MSGILFNEIPGSGLVAPIFSFEVNSGGQYTEEHRFILIGHATSAGSIQPNVLTPVSDQNTVDLLTGPGSQLREMFRVAAANAPAEPFYVLATAEVGTAPVWAVTVNALSGTGTGLLVIEGETLPIAIGATDTAATIASAIGSAINGYYNALTGAMLPVIASVSADVVTVTSRHKGAIFNEIDFYVPANLGANAFGGGVLSIAQTAQGTGVPVVGSALAALAEGPADFIVCPWSDATSLTAYAALTNDSSGRWAWNRQSYGHVWTAATDTFAGLVTLGQSLNDRHLTIIGRGRGVQAAYTLNLPNQPADGTTVTVGGTAITFKAASPNANQVLIGASVSATIASLVTLINGSSDAGITKVTALPGAQPGTVVLTAQDSSALGNYIGVSTTVAGASVAQTTVANGSPHASWLWIAGFAARLAPWLSDCETGNVSRNQTGLAVQGVAPPRDRAVYQAYNGRNVLVSTGISTWKVARDGSLLVDKIVTTYQTGTAGLPDGVFRDVQSVYQVAGSLNYIRTALANEQSNKSLSDANPGNLGAITTPANVKATIAHAVTDLVNQGVLRDADQTIQLMTVQPNAGDPARLDAIVPLNRVSPFDVLAANATIYQKLPAAA